MDLLDSSVWLERLLSQARSQEVGEYLAQVPAHEIAVTDFAFHSIALALYRLGQVPALAQFVQDFRIDNPVHLLSLPADRFTRVVEIISAFNLDYDDAYQYAVAEHYNLRLLSFDSDFDNTPLGRITPAEFLAQP